MPMLQPTNYTDVESGHWKVWPAWALLPPGVLAQRALKHVKACEYNGETLHVHSLAFGDVTRGEGNFSRWDCINGWTTKELALDSTAEADHESLPASA